jgi:hypothetical protein
MYSIIPQDNPLEELYVLEVNSEALPSSSLEFGFLEPTDSLKDNPRDSPFINSNRTMGIPASTKASRCPIDIEGNLVTSINV